jgi:hypothetical protein
MVFPRIATDFVLSNVLPNPRIFMPLPSQQPPTIKSSLKSVVGLVINLLGVAIYLEDMAFGTVPMIVGLVINLLGVAIYLKDMAFGTVPMIVGLVINLLGVAFHDLCLVLEFRLP